MMALAWTAIPLIRRVDRRYSFPDLGAGLGPMHARSGGFGSNERVRILA